MKYILSLLIISAILFFAAGLNYAADDMMGQSMSMDDGTMEDGEAMGHQMEGLLGSYPASREGSGTSWQPDSTRVGSMQNMHGDTMLMMHEFTNIIYDEQSGPRGGNKIFSTNMFMFMAGSFRELSKFGFRGMLSLEPGTIGNEGYPLIFQTGESSDGKTPLIDRQHPHDLFMELALTYSIKLSQITSLFIYAALPGEPALGPVTFMHRFSGMYLPAAPISHHWLDSTHVTFGVVTAGYIWKNIKIESSVFRGREPDEYRWDIEQPEFDSYSGRISFNPSADWALQASYGRLSGTETLKPGIITGRTTLSAVYNNSFEMNNWQTTFALGRNSAEGRELNAILIESTLGINDTHYIFSRCESVEKNELFLPSDPRVNSVYTLSKIELGYERFFALSDIVSLGIGASYALNFAPAELKQEYGNMPAGYMLFAGIRSNF